MYLLYKISFKSSETAHRVQLRGEVFRKSVDLKDILYNKYIIFNQYI
jgi:hypothetical protein